MKNTTFTLAGVTLPDDQDPLGVWSVARKPMMSFSTAATMKEAVPVWHVSLPETAEQSHATLDAQRALLLSASSDLSRAEREMQHLSSQSTISFSATDPLLAQKTALLSAIEASQESIASYSIARTQTQQPERRILTEQWLTLVKQVRRMLRNYATIQTTIAGINIGLTQVSWTGDRTTMWASEASLPRMQLHQKAVDLTLTSRLALMRIISVIASGTASLALRTSVPGAQVLLLPAAWRFVRDVLKELRTLKERKDLYADEQDRL